MISRCPDFNIAVHSVSLGRLNRIDRAIGNIIDKSRQLNAHAIPDRGASAALGIWCAFPSSVTTEVDASSFERYRLPSFLLV